MAYIEIPRNLSEVLWSNIQLEIVKNTRIFFLRLIWLQNQRHRAVGELGVNVTVVKIHSSHKLEKPRRACE